MPTLSKAQLATRLSTDVLFVAPSFARQAEWMLAAVTDAELESLQQTALTATAAAFDGRPYRVTDSGMAVIPIHGYLAHRVPYHSPGRMTGYDYITGLARHAREDPDVRGVVLDVNSGGGEVAGAFEAADEIAALAADKPVWAIVDASSYSAAYLLSAAADRIVVPRAGGAGSIGVVTMHVDVSQLLDNFGVKITLLYAGERKVDGNMFEGMSEDARSRIEAKLEASYNLFVNSVASNRGLDPADVRGTEAGTFQGQEAVDVGLVDAVMSPTEAYAAFERELIGSISNGGSGMSTEQTQQEGAETGDQASNGAQAPQVDTGAVRAEGAQAERQRVSAILGSEEAKGREDLAKHLAFESDMTAEAAVAVLGKSPKAEASAAPAGSPLDRAMEATGGGPAVGEGSGDEPEMSDSQRILADYAAATGERIN